MLCLNASCSRGLKRHRLRRLCETIGLALLDMLLSSDSVLNTQKQAVLEPGCLTCTSVSIEGPSGALGVDGHYSDVVRGVGEQILQHGVVPVSWNHSLRIKTPGSQRLSDTEENVSAKMSLLLLHSQRILRRQGEGF